VLEEVERLAKIVEGLFALSRLDAGDAQKEWVQFDLARLADQHARDLGHPGARRNLGEVQAAFAAVDRVGFALEVPPAG
jgi:signal transduction histidine kinase